jgi:crotonobetainyl-CoA:carnitine CoA-transferase CaiB-like acyl-CoA transferase
MTAVRRTDAPAERPLTGVRVLDLTRLLPGGLGTLLLADLGAEVVKVEAPGDGDYARNREPFRESSDPSTASMTFVGLNRDKRSIVLDLKADADRAAFLALVAEADVVVESFRPGVLDRLGIGYEALRAVNPAIVLCSISGWGQTGPMAQRAGHDINYLAAMGLLSPTGRLDDPPVLSAMQICDSTAGLLAALTILAALRDRDRTGQGQWLDVSLAHAGLLMSAMSVASTLGTGRAASGRTGLWSGGVVCYQTYRCQDGWVALGALEEKFWTTWCDAVGHHELAGSRYEPTGSATHAVVTEIFAARTVAEWRDFANEHDCCLTVVDGLAEALASDLVTERGIVHHITQTGVDDPVAALGLPVGFSRSDTTPGVRPAPSLGQDSSAIWTEPARTLPTPEVSTHA